MDTTQWPQELGGLVKPLEEMIAGAGASRAAPAQAQAAERRARPQKEKALNCPRCNSTNTKFCYYNNYSLTQPRYFCKTCRRYWTEGGSLRNVPVGGGSRKNKRSSSSSSSASASNSTTNINTTATAATNNSMTISNKNKLTNNAHVDMIALSSPSHSMKFNQSLQDLNLAFPYHHSMPHEYTTQLQFPNSSSSSCNNNSNSNTTVMELLRSGMSGSSRESFMPMPLHHEYPSGLGFLHEFRPPTTTLGNFPLDHGHGEVATAAAAAAAAVGGSSGNYDESTLQESRLLFPFEDLKPAAHVVSNSTGEMEHSRMQSGDPPAGFWNGMIHGGGGGGGGGGGSW